MPKSSLPDGYSFVPKGNVYITSNCRKMTQESGRSVYLVIDEKQHQIGIGVPIEVYVGVQFKERSTRAERAANVVKRDEGIAKGFQKEIMDIFPQIPPDALRNVAKIALQKGKGKVGRVGKLDVQRKARLAVWAHVRHRETDYDVLLRSGVPREEARQQVEAKIKEVYKAWGVGSQTKHGKTRKTSKSSARPNSKSPQARKGAKKVNLLQSKKKAKLSISKAAIISASSPRASNKAGQFTSEPNAAYRNAKRVHRQIILENWVQIENEAPKQQRTDPRTSSPKVIATAASFREKRTPKPCVIEPIAPSPPKAKTRWANPSIPDLDHENRAHLLRFVERIDTIERAHKIACKKERKRHMTRLRTIESLNNRINGILQDAFIQTIEFPAKARQDLVKQLRRKVRTSEQRSS